MREVSRMLRALAAAPPVSLEVLEPPLAPGTCLDEFELESVIGEGGMSVVYRARDRHLDREVAVKVLRPSWGLPAFDRDELELEARATARLRHPRVVTVHRIGRHGRSLYLVFELLKGETLAARLQRRPLTAAEVAGAAHQLVAALAHAHAQGVVHGDVKPGNVFVEASGDIKLLDFGLSALRARPGELRALGPESAAGTPAYMAPELWRGEPADERTDVYAAGLVLGELAAARARWAPRCRIEAIEAVAARATAADREERFANAGAMASALAGRLAGAIE